MLSAAWLAGCAGAPVATTAAAPAVCVVSMDGSGPECPDAPSVEPLENTEPCVERVADGFNHGPMARVYAFCTPAESARKAVQSLERDADE